jgi:ribonuclease VapC
LIAVDTSALLAILFGEPDDALYLDAIGAASEVALSAASLVELALVGASRAKLGRSLVFTFVADLEIVVVALDFAQAQLAADGFARFGKGRDRAGLNYGDCFSYALAKSLNAPLLFKGHDFSHTDVTPVIRIDPAQPNQTPSPRG